MTNSSPVPRLGRVHTSDEVAERLLRDIITVELPPGLPISENELARRYNVSRTPVREAVIRLRSRGLIETIPQVGTFVAKIDEASVRESQFVREALERAAVRRVVETASQADLDSLADFLDSQTARAEAHDYEGFWIHDEGMHCAITSLTGHATIWQTILQYKVHMDRVRRLSLPVPGLLPRLVHQHESLVDALVRRDTTAAEAAVSEHMDEVLQHLPILREIYPLYFVPLNET